MSSGNDGGGPAASASDDGKCEEQQELPLYSRAEVSRHTHPTTELGAWIVIDDFVYDVTEFIHEHPGGLEIILENVGRDASFYFHSMNHSQDAKKKLATLKIGRLQK